VKFSIMGIGKARPEVLRVACIATLLALSACGSSGSSNNQAYSERFSDAPALLTQCVLERGSLAGPFEQTADQWMSSGEVHITAANAAAFLTWFKAHDPESVAGKSLASWRQWSAQNNALPQSVCGSDASDPSAMQKLIFSQDSAAGDPWSK
jgi:hypothetical protein